MKLDGKAQIFVYLLALIVEFILKSSNIPFLVALEPMLMTYVILLAIKSEWSITFIYLFGAILLDLCLIRPVGLASAVLFIAFAIIKFINRIFNLSSESKLVFNILVVLLALFIKIGLQALLGLPLTEVNLGIVLGISLVFVILQMIIQRVFSTNVFKR